MKQLLVVIAILIYVLSGSSAHCAGDWQYSAGPWLGYSFGDTQYRLEYVEFGSELIFSTKLQQAGFGVQARKLKHGRTDWSFSGRLVFAISDPAEKFTDRDWVVDPLLNGLGDISYTESNVVGSNSGFEFEVAKNIFTGSKLELAALLGVGRQKIQQDAIDFEGWQLFYDPIADELERFFFQIDTLALSYEVTYTKPQIGLVPRWRVSANTLIEAKVTWAPYLHVKDQDDHWLRKFTTTSSGGGSGVFFRVGAENVFGDASSGKMRLMVKMDFEYSSMTANLKSTQAWYGNDPSDDEYDAFGNVITINDNTGQSFSGIPHKITSKQQGLFFRLGLVF